MYVLGFMALVTVMVLRARSQDSLVSVRRAHVVFLTVGFKGKGNPRPKTRETAARGEASSKLRAGSWDRTPKITSKPHPVDI